MSRVVQRRWIGNPDALSRRGRMPCDYEAYIPDPLTGRTVTLDGGVAADVADAETAITRLEARASTLADTEGLARLLLRAESVASSRIEGLEVGARKLLRTEAARQLGERVIDLTAAEVLGNINAMNVAVRELGPGDQISPETLRSFHRRLMANSRLSAHAGQFREQQNWIGGSEYNPCSAAFVPPPPELVPGLIDDLCAFCSDDSLPAVVQAALAHAQFETIHPFADGNGRTGRGLIHLVLRRRGLATRVLPPVSLVLATWAKDYVDGLTATRYTGSATGDAARAGLNQWIGTFAGACVRAAGDADSFENRVEQIEASWRAQVGRIRSGSATDLLLRALPGAPVLSVGGAAELTGRSYPQVNEAIGRLVSAGVLAQISVGKRNRAFEAKDIINAFSDLERQLASPEGDTRNSEPARPVPRRRPTLCGPIVLLPDLSAWSLGLAGPVGA
jgi:Fic family protein